MLHLVREVQEVLAGNVGTARIRHYLDFLDRALLLRAVRPLEIRLKRTKGANKLCLADHGLRAAWLGELIPLAPDRLHTRPELMVLAGRIAESVLGSYFLTLPGATVSHFPQRDSEPEVDFVLTVGDYRIPVEVKFRKTIDAGADTAGLRHFIDKRVYRAPFGVLVTLDDGTNVHDERIVTLPLSSVLLMH